MLQSWQLLVAFAGLSDEESRYFITEMNRYLFCSPDKQKKMCDEWRTHLSQGLKAKKQVKH